MHRRLRATVVIWVVSGLKGEYVSCRVSQTYKAHHAKTHAQKGKWRGFGDSGCADCKNDTVTIQS